MLHLKNACALKSPASDLKIKFDEQLYVDFSETDNTIFEL